MAASQTPAGPHVGEPLRPLILEDSPRDLRLLTEILRGADFHLVPTHAETPEVFRQHLDQGSYDIVIADYNLRNWTAIDALEIVRASGQDIPVIVVSGSLGDEAAANCIKQGATDYVLKDRMARLPSAIRNALAEKRHREKARETEESLRLSQERFSRLANSGIIGIAIADVHGALHDANDAYLNLLGFTHEDLRLGKVNWTNSTPEDWRTGDAVAIEQLKSTGSARPWEKEIMRKDGTRVPVLVGVAMLDYPKCIAFVADLTDRKRAEAERARFAVVAEKESAARKQTQEALRQTEEQLRQAQKMEAIGRLAGGVAHDFNNLLTVILAYGEMALDTLRPDDPLYMEITEIKKAGERAANLTRQLLMFSRRQVLEPKIIDLNELLTGMKAMLDRLVGEDVDLVFVPTQPLARVKVDPGSMEQVVMNLVVNSRDAMPTGGKLTIETANIVLDETYATNHLGITPGPHAMLVVTDTGVGIDKETQRRIFEPFFTTKGESKGTGLGLSTVLGIVQQNGGSVWVYSEVGKGTTFKVYLPRVETPIQADEPVVEPEKLRGSETILLVEDEDAVRVLASAILRKHGYQVIESRNGGEAFLLCEKHGNSIHLLLSDVVMPQVSGPELAKRLKQNRPAMKTLFMSGYTDDSIVRHGVLEGKVAFLQKPLTPNALLKKVRAVLNATD